MASLVRVGGEQMWVGSQTRGRRSEPSLTWASRWSYGTDSKQVAGGGLLITAERIHEDDGR